MRTLLRFLVAFLAVTGAVVLATGLFSVEFGRSDYWDHHGALFLVFITLFPRLTLLFSSVPFGGLFWWLGWLFAPRFLVAVLATLAYWHQNPVLVVISWLVAFGGESSEKYVVVHRTAGRRWAPRATGRRGGHGFDEAEWVDSEVKRD